MSSPSEPVDTTSIVFDDLAVAQPHDRALAELLFDLRQRGLQGLGFLGVERFDGCIHRESSWGLRRLWQTSWMFVQWFIEPRQGEPAPVCGGGLPRIVQQTQRGSGHMPRREETVQCAS